MEDSVKDPLTQTIIGCCYDVHTQLGPGFLEKNFIAILRDTYPVIWPN